jgi:hypothetical protein
MINEPLIQLVTILVRHDRDNVAVARLIDQRHQTIQLAVVLASVTTYVVVRDQLRAFRRQWGKVNIRYARSKNLTPYDVLIIGAGAAGRPVVSVNSGASLLALLNPAAPGNAGAVALFTAGSDIIVNDATLQADRGAISLFQTAAPSAGTAQITLNGGTISTETLSANSRGDLTVGTTTPVNLSAVTLSFIATNDINWEGGTQSATAILSSGTPARSRLCSQRARRTSPGENASPAAGVRMPSPTSRST